LRNAPGFFRVIVLIISTKPQLKIYAVSKRFY